MWTQINIGRTIVNLANPSSVKPTFISPSVIENGESLIFQLTVTNSCGIQSTDTCIVNVIKTNKPPVANAGPDQQVSEGTTVDLDGSNSLDTDGNIISYMWEQIEGNEVHLDFADSAQASFFAPYVAPDDETYVFQLTIIDNGELISTDTCIINIGNNIPPIANAGEDQTVIEGKTVTLNGSNSVTMDGSTVLYKWQQISGAPVTLSNTIVARPTFVAPPVSNNGHDGIEVLIFLLTVTDNRGSKDSDEVKKTINDNGIIGFQENVITTITSTTKELGIEINEDKGSIISFETIDPNTIDGVTKKPDDLPYGLIDIGIKVYTPGENVEVTIHLSSPAPEDYRWYKYSATKRWYDFSENAIFNVDRTQVTLILSDGGSSDEDGVKNGVIIDPSGLGIFYPTEFIDPNNPGITDENDNGGSGDGELVGGGCFIMSLK